MDDPEGNSFFKFALGFIGIILVAVWVIIALNKAG